MAKIGISTFTKYDLTDKELLAGSILTYDQKAVIQTELATTAESLLALDFNPLNPTKYAQDEAFLRGQISVFRLLLDRSDISEKQLANPSSI